MIDGIDQIDEENEEIIVEIIWGKQQIDIIKKASNLIGISYQDYIKYNIFKRVIEDIELYNKIKV